MKINPNNTNMLNNPQRVGIKSSPSIINKQMEEFTDSFISEVKKEQKNLTPKKNALLKAYNKSLKKHFPDLKVRLIPISQLGPQSAGANAMMLFNPFKKIPIMFLNYDKLKSIKNGMDNKNVVVDLAKSIAHELTHLKWFSETSKKDAIIANSMEKHFEGASLKPLIFRFEEMLYSGNFKNTDDIKKCFKAVTGDISQLSRKQLSLVMTSFIEHFKNEKVAYSMGTKVQDALLDQKTQMRFSKDGPSFTRETFAKRFDDGIKALREVLIEQTIENPNVKKFVYKAAKRIV